LLSELSVRQSEVRELLTAAREVEDKTLVDGLTGNLGHDDRHVEALVLVRLELTKEPDRDIVPMDLIWAGEVLDHLDTQGYHLCRR
jgi:hypothetical protein